MIRKENIEFLRCQQCLNELNLSLSRKELVCKRCNINYPISNGLIFMGYDVKNEKEIKKIIVEARDHHTNLDEVQKHYDFAYPSFMIGILAIKILKNQIKSNNPTAIDLGSGGAPMAKILSDHGFNTFRCEIDPNSLYSGLFWKHKHLDIGKHIVCDARILPFANNSVDAVFCKEFIHHIYDYSLIFQEINRVLKREGIFLMIEPTLSFRFLRTKDRLRPEEEFGHHYDSINNYYTTLKRNGFLPYLYYLYYYSQSKRLKFLSIIKKYFIKQIHLQSKTSKFGLLFKILMQRVLGGSNVILSRKYEAVYIKNRAKRNIRINTIDPCQLILGENYLRDPRLSKFNEILEKAYFNLTK